MSFLIYNAIVRKTALGSVPWFFLKAAPCVVPGVATLNRKIRDHNCFISVATVGCVVAVLRLVLKELLVWGQKE